MRVLALLLLPTAALAQDEPGPIREGAGMLLRGLVEEAQPAIDGIAEFGADIGADVLPTFRVLAREMGPAFVDVFGRIDAIENYEGPVLMPNGDVLIRRRADAPAWEPPAP